MSKISSIESQMDTVSMANCLLNILQFYRNPQPNPHQDSVQPGLGKDLKSLEDSDLTQRKGQWKGIRKHFHQYNCCMVSHEKVFISMCHPSVKTVEATTGMEVQERATPQIRAWHLFLTCTITLNKSFTLCDSCVSIIYNLTPRSWWMLWKHSKKWETGIIFLKWCMV
jgi:hypothetical protein